jgi:hypothetical protein
MLETNSSRTQGCRGSILKRVNNLSLRVDVSFNITLGCVQGFMASEHLHVTKGATDGRDFAASVANESEAT